MGGGGGVMEPLLGFLYVTMFWKDFAFSLWCALQDEIYIMGCGAAGGLWRHHLVL